jgi:hypothetical protein
MIRAFQISCILLVLTAVVAVGACGFAAYKAFEKLGEAADGVTATLVNVNRPCKGPAGPDACGTLAEINKATIQVGDIVKSSQMEEKDTAKAAQATMTAVDQMAAHAGALTDSLAGTASAATGTLAQARVDLGTMNDSIAATKPLLEASTATIGRLGVASDDLDTLLKRKAIGDLLDQFAGIATHGNAIAGDFQQVADKARADYLRKTPWYLQPVKRAGDIMDISAAIARHTP